ncbi:UDP-glucosyltransferase 2-like [Schistocerca nitens]|uniref:UDP-glucosyltransferase 2-like n=1 Tax=Schistocerca nitens TaxID=7011 RepID=UPI002119B321|nr:UDP-glucosyltransferase 2-like [Schistocerca nitens]
MRTSVLWALLLFAGVSQCARILGINPTRSISHQTPFLAIMAALAEKGHQVTVVTTHPLKVPPKGLTQIDVAPLIPMGETKEQFEDIAEVTNKELQESILPWSEHICDTTLVYPEIQQLLRSKDKFDLVVLETLFFWCYFGFIHELGSPPVVGFLSVGMTPTLNSLIGNPYNPSYIPDSHSVLTSHMSFWDRMRNSYDVLNLLSHFYNHVLPAHSRLIEKHYGKHVPDLEEMISNISLVIAANHFSIDYPQPLLPNVVQVTGMHIVQERKPLPKEIQDFLDGAEHGFIYFSLGSNMKSSFLPENTLAALLQAFAELPQRVLWKFEATELPGRPDNVMIAGWLPQQDVLAHKNIRLFITQGGLQSFNEAAYFGVPLIGIPFFFDQKYEVAKMVSAGIGKKLVLRSLTKETALDALNGVLRNSSYREKMEQFSAVYREHQETSLQRAVWWVEYVLRHDGAPHLRSAATHLRWWQLLLLDAIAVLLAAALVVIFVVYKLVRCLRSALRRNNKQKQS